MSVSSELQSNGVGVVTVDYPPVNALPIDGWFAIADEVTDLGKNSSTRSIILRSEGRGFNAGLILKKFSLERDTTPLSK